MDVLFFLVLAVGGGVAWFGYIGPAMAKTKAELKERDRWFDLLSKYEQAFVPRFGQDGSWVKPIAKDLQKHFPHLDLMQITHLMSPLSQLRELYQLNWPHKRNNEQYVFQRTLYIDRMHGAWENVTNYYISAIKSYFPQQQPAITEPFLTIESPVSLPEHEMMTLLQGPILSLNTWAAAGTFKFEYDNVAKKYMFGTGQFSILKGLKMTYAIPVSSRFEHMWVVAPPGAGKSTLLSGFINRDMDAVARGECSVIVMESNRDLVKSIERLARFAPGGDLAGRLVSIDVEDVEFPVALNLFDMGLDDITASLRDKEALYNSTVSMLDYVFRALLGAELTSRQSTLFNFTIQLLLTIPNATLDTMIDLMQKGGAAKYSDDLKKCDDDTQKFFATKFDAKELEQTKSQIVDRLFAIKRIRAISRMFGAPKTKLNLYEEMGKGRVILINAAKSLLQEDGVEIFTRFFLASILLAAEKRQLLSQAERLPCYVYIDEAQDTIRRDEKLPVILDQARKFRVGITLAHQRLDQMSAPVLNALYSSTAIKMAANLSDANASAMARNMGASAEQLRDTPKYHMLISVRGVTQTAVLYPVPDFSFDREVPMAPAQMDAVRQEMRVKFSTDRSGGQPQKPTSPAKIDPKQKNDEDTTW